MNLVAYELDHITDSIRGQVYYRSHTFKFFLFHTACVPAIYHGKRPNPRHLGGSVPEGKSS